MTFSRRTLAFYIIPLSLAGGTAAWAQSVIIDDGPVIAGEAAVVPADPDADLLDGNSTRVIVPERRGAVVYGWQGCGTYFFWNGERCVDARIAPQNR